MAHIREVHHVLTSFERFAEKYRAESVDLDMLPRFGLAGACTKIVKQCVCVCVCLLARLKLWPANFLAGLAQSCGNLSSTLVIGIRGVNRPDL